MKRHGGIRGQGQQEEFLQAARTFNPARCLHCLALRVRVSAHLANRSSLQRAAAPASAGCSARDEARWNCGCLENSIHAHRVMQAGRGRERGALVWQAVLQGKLGAACALHTSSTQALALAARETAGGGDRENMGLLTQPARLDGPPKEAPPVLPEATRRPAAGCRAGRAACQPARLRPAGLPQLALLCRRAFQPG